MTKFKSVIHANLFAATALLGSAAFAAGTPPVVVPAKGVATSSAYGFKADVKVAKSVVTATAQIGGVSGSAPSSYDKTATVAAVNEQARLVDGFATDAYQSLKTGVITNKASSDFPNTIGAKASSQVDGLDIDFTTQLLRNIPLLSFGVDARTLTSATSVGVDAQGNLVSSGTSRIEGLGVGGSLLGALTVDGKAYVDAKPNTVISLAGITITLNEQKEVRTGASDIFRYTNAINIGLLNYSVLGSIVTGNIIIGHSEAGISGYVPGFVIPGTPAVPEPATWAMMILGFGLVGAAARRRGTAAAALAV